ncbi:hypothetical protein [Streptomyces sp. NPDC058307]|uniref:hypothetical protein n=1 Tax=Streptomyces sp. NPDC058307 TaxID=3346439 RepID=UPI0036E83F7D
MTPLLTRGDLETVLEPEACVDALRDAFSTADSELPAPPVPATVTAWRTGRAAAVGAAPICSPAGEKVPERSGRPSVLVLDGSSLPIPRALSPVTSSGAILIRSRRRGAPK